MAEFNKCGRIGSAALKAGIDRKTASKYVSAGKLPSELVEDRHWRTRQDPFVEHWPWVAERLREAPKLEARTLFDELRRLHPERYKDGQLRTLQRQARRWRPQRGPEREIFFPQAHLPRQLAQTDFTSTGELGITICGEFFAHLLCKFVLVYSNWQWLTVCLSESFLAVKRGVQEALHRLGHVPAEHQTENSTAATHQEGTKRTFNEWYVALMNHYNMRYRTTGIGQKEQNGDVEASNGALKRKLEQLLLRGSRDFETVDAYEKWLEERQTRWNAQRSVRFQEELLAMKAVDVPRLPDYQDLRCKVTQQSTMRIERNAYSVPSRLMGHEVRVRLFERTLEAWVDETCRWRRNVSVAATAIASTATCYLVVSEKASGLCSVPISRRPVPVAHVS